MSRKNEATRNRILNTTWKLLEKDGAAAVRMGDIARASGISRQALYLHFSNRSELLIATVRFLDEVYDVDARLSSSRSAKTGRDRLNAWIEAWGNYIPDIYGVAKALMDMRDTDPAAAQAWSDRMVAMREGCSAVVKALQKEEQLAPHLTSKQATDALWSLLSIQMWELLVKECGWSQKAYVTKIKQLAAHSLILSPN